MLKRLLALSAVALLCCQPYFVQAEKPCRDCVRIGSWNIQDFGGERRKQTAAAAELAELIADQWQIDLLALQEINVDSRAWRELRNALQQRGYQVAEGQSGRQQSLVWVWRQPVVSQTKITELRTADRYQPAADCRSGALRKPLHGYFRAGQFDFHAVNVHLKSSYGDAHCAHQVRELQSKELVRLLRDLERRDPDVILLGDFNATANHASLAPLSQRMNLISKNALAPHSGRSTQGKPERGNIIDLILIDPRATGEWLKRSSVAFAPNDENQFYRRYSDHRPVWADFDTRRDDD